MIPQRQPHLRAGPIVPAEGMCIQRAILVRGAAEKADFLPVKKFPDDDEAVPVIGGDFVSQ